MKIFLQLLLFHYLAFGLDLRGIQSFSNWEHLQSGTITINWCTYQNFPVSRAETVLNHPIDLVADAVQGLDQYPEIFERVTKTKRLETDVVQVVLDMPFPFDGRDYIVKYNIENSPNQWTFSFSAVEHPNGKLDPDHVRLPNAAGIWILTKVNDKQTNVVYGWNGELLGNFPDFGLTKAWVTQGNEVLNWLDEALTKRKNS